jgi:hypothetical protein
MIKLGLRKNGP